MFKRIGQKLKRTPTWVITLFFCLVMAVLMFQGIRGIVEGVYQIRTTVPGDEIRSHLTATAKVTEARLVQWVYDHSTKISRAQCQEIVREAMKYRYPELLLAIIELESVKFSPGSLSSVGAIGWCQINAKEHAAELIKAGIIKEVRDLWDTGPNIRAGAYILDQKLKHTKSVADALNAYRGGRNDIYVLRILSNHADLSIPVQS